MTKPSWVIVIVEDDHHRMLVYRYLYERGIGTHQMRIVRSPSGQGSAENWVRKTCVKEVNSYRLRQARAKTALIIAIDADVLTVQDRLTQLDQALRDNGKKPVGKTEEIARLIPKRNIETWILCLNGQAVEEKTDYKKKRDDWNELIPPAAHTLSQWVKSEDKLPKHCVESLQHGVQELRRLHL